jgi:hypothetical protein
LGTTAVLFFFDRGRQSLAARFKLYTIKKLDLPFTWIGLLDGGVVLAIT